MQVDLVCTRDATLSLGAIAGTLTVTDPLGGTTTPLGGAKITLQDSLGAAVAATYTAADGEFAFYDLADGTYTLMASAEGYTAVSSVTTVITGGSIANVAMTMTVGRAAPTMAPSAGSFAITPATRWPAALWAFTR